MSDATSYGKSVGAQVERLIDTHEILMHSDAALAARKVRHALQNYMQQVDHVLGEQDGGRSPRSQTQVEEAQAVDPSQVDIEDDIRRTEIEEGDPVTMPVACPECSYGFEAVRGEAKCPGCSHEFEVAA